jgi:psiF repeat
MNRSLVNATLLSLTIGMGTAFAQTPPGQTAQMGRPGKEAISKACSDQANTKGLHGKARKKFRSECKRAGGKAM